MSHKQQLSRDHLLPWLLSPGSGLLCSASEQHRLHLYNTLFTRQCLSRSCPTFCDPVDCSPPGTSVHGILQARTLEWAAIPFSRKVKVKVTQSCPNLCERGLHSPSDSPGQNTEVVSLSLLQGIVPTQGLNPGLPQC